MDLDILNVDEKPIFDNSITSYEHVTYNTYTNSYDYGDEIRIGITHEDLYILPSDSLIYINAQVVKADDETKQPLAGEALIRPNFGLFLFDEIRYEINGHCIDKCKNPGITTTIKNYLSYSRHESKTLKVSSWSTDNTGILGLVDPHYRFEISIPLKIIFGFAEDYRKVIINAKHELILIRGRNDSNGFIKTGTATSEPKVKILKIQLKVPHVTVNDSQKIKLLHHLERNSWLPIAYRSWDLYEYPSLPKSSNHTWSVRTSSQMEKPRFVILCFQTNRKHSKTRAATLFDHCDLKTAKCYLNSIAFPRDEIQTDFSQFRYAQLYNMYTNFQLAYYGRRPNPMFNISEFLNTVMIVFNTSRQVDSIKNSTVDIRLEWEFSQNAPDKTSALCLILHDKICEYNPFNGLLRELQ